MHKLNKSYLQKGLAVVMLCSQRVYTRWSNRSSIWGKLFSEIKLIYLQRQNHIFGFALSDLQLFFVYSSWLNGTFQFTDFPKFDHLTLINPWAFSILQYHFYNAEYNLNKISYIFGQNILIAHAKQKLMQHSNSDLTPAPSYPLFS